MNRENEKVITVVENALKEYGADAISVDLNEENMIDVDICGQHWNEAYMSSVVRYDKCDIEELERELHKKNIRYCLSSNKIYLSVKMEKPYSNSLFDKTKINL